MNKNEMIKKEIADFIKLPAPDRYDLRFSAAEASARHEGFRDAYEKFFVYKYKTQKKPDCNRVWGYMGENSDLVKRKFEAKARNYGPMSDPDENSELLQEIYKTIWIDEENITDTKEFIYKNNGKIASDAMTSVQGLLKGALQKIIDKNENKEIVFKRNEGNREIMEHIQRVYDGCVASKEKQNASQECWTVLFDVLVAAELSAAELDEEFYRFIDHYYPNMREFMNRCFTIGNYCPVSAEFNTARSKYDYWDLTLMKIREWYIDQDNADVKEDEKDKALRDLFSCEKTDNCEACSNCIKWLNWAAQDKKGKDGWKSFVDKLYMQDYVVDYVNKNYKVKPFWEGHGWENSKENPGTPGTKSLNTPKKMNDALIEISARIAARSVRILNALQEKMKKNNIEELI